MVEIKNIKTYYCPVCGCREVIEERVELSAVDGKIAEHCNGGHWEHRKFACGYQIHYCPNFCKETTESYCKYDPGELARKEQEQQTKTDILDQIANSNCPEAFKERLRNAIQYV